MKYGLNLSAMKKSKMNKRNFLINISITSIIILDPGDYVQVWAKSDTASTTITVETLQITLWGEK